MRSHRFAFFDLDGTLLPFDTQLLFCNHVLRAEPWRRIYLAFFLPFVPLAVGRVLRSREMKRLFLSYLCGMRAGRLDELARGFASGTVPAACYPELLDEVRRHRREGRTLVLNTASPEFYASHIARELGFDYCVATRVVVGERMPLVPDIDGPNNKREAKIGAMRRLLPSGYDPRNGPLPDSFAYTDSAVDLPLLACAGSGVVVHPDRRLEELAAEGGWTILRPPLPFCCGAARHLAQLRQACGLFRPPFAWLPAGSARAGTDPLP